MKNRFILFLVLLSFNASAQKANPFNKYIPIMELPSIDWSSPMNEDEPIVFNGKASIYYHFINSYGNEAEKTKHAL